MTRDEIEKNVLNCIRQVASDQSIDLEEMKFHHAIVEDLGFASLDVATLTAFLESTFKVDPFTSGMAVITEIRTIQDICNLYDRCLNGSEDKGQGSNLNQSDDARLKRRMTRKAG